MGPVSWAGLTAESNWVSPRDLLSRGPRGEPTLCSAYIIIIFTAVDEIYERVLAVINRVRRDRDRGGVTLPACIRISLVPDSSFPRVRPVPFADARRIFCPCPALDLSQWHGGTRKVLRPEGPEDRALSVHFPGLAVRAQARRGASAMQGQPPISGT